MKKSTLTKLAGTGFAIALAVSGYLFLHQTGNTSARASASPPLVPVSAGIAETKDVPILVRGLGTVQAFKTVTVKARVDGQIVKVLFKEGQDVTAGTPLFQIDPRPYQAMLDSANAAKKRNEALLLGAQLDLERYSKLIGSGFQSRQSVDQQQAVVDGLKGSLSVDQANIDTATLNLAYTDIRAPIDGRTGQLLVDLGNLVQASQATSLVGIAQIKPIFVNFTVPQDYSADIRRAQATAPLEVFAYASDDKTLLSKGHVSLIDNQIDVATGTQRMKATFENGDALLWPGEFVNVRLVLSTRAATVTVPQRAVMQGPSGYYAYVIRQGDTVERRDLAVAGMQDGIAIIDRGIAAGERIVVDGQYRLTNGARVRIDEDKPATETPATAAPPVAAKAG
jgi:multidrug efflux system membrane fusion protein